MSWRARDHQPRTEMYNAKCSKCGEQTRVPFDPKAEPGKVVMCRNCRNIYMP
jgi:CxxC-x17-CxxC domain-containing protein